MEIPDKNKNLHLYIVVIKYMMHGHYGILNPTNVYMKKMIAAKTIIQIFLRQIQLLAMIVSQDINVLTIELLSRIEATICITVGLFHIILIWLQHLIVILMYKFVLQSKQSNISINTSTKAMTILLSTWFLNKTLNKLMKLNNFSQFNR